MFLILCRTNNQKPKIENIIDSHLTLADAKIAFRKQCKEHKESLVFEGENIAMFSYKDENWVLEIWEEIRYYK